jgi:hypothetical protein
MAADSGSAVRSIIRPKDWISAGPVSSGEFVGTFRMPEGRLPQGYRTDDPRIPNEIVGQLAYPFRREVCRAPGIRSPFAVRSPIDGRFASSGAGSAAYRLSRLVNVPGYCMSPQSLRFSTRARFAFYSLAAGMLMWPMAAVAEPSINAISVNVDQARLVKLPARVATIVVGNPLIADVALQSGGVLVVTGKGYGATNFIAMDRAGEVLVDRQIQVEGPTDQLITVYRGVDRESYSCMPMCQRRVTLGDGDNYFKSAITQAGNLSNQASGNAKADAAEKQ